MAKTEEQNKVEYRPLTIPKIEWNKKTLSKTSAQLIAQPLEPGFGVTFGNALRRVLLGAIEGVAVTSVIIKDINNEFSAIQGVVEDAMQVLLNIKQIVITSKDGKPGKMRLRSSGETVVRVSDIEVDNNLTLVNGDHVIAHVARDGNLDIEFFVEPGRGYQVAQWPLDKSYQENGRIYLDALFSPVLKVTFDVEKTRVGKDIDYDKLILTIETNGSENPTDVLHYAVSVLRTQLEHFLSAAEVPFNEISRQAEPKEDVKPLSPALVKLSDAALNMLLKPIDVLELSVRAHNCLAQANIDRVIDLVNIIEDDALKIKNFGRKSLNEVKDTMTLYGLSYGMNITQDDVLRVLQDRADKQ